MVSSRLTRKDVQVLSVLGRRPLEPIKVLSKEADMTTTTVSKRMKQLYNEGILISISAEVSYSSVGLEQFFFFIETPFETIAIVERALDLHPYTRFRVRCLGETNGHFVMFAVPTGSLPLLLEFFEEIGSRGLIKGYRYDVSISSWAYTETDFKHYDVIDDSWDFDWRWWEVNFPETPSPLQDTPSVFSYMDDRDMRILRQLTIDARDKKKEIADRAGIPNYHLTRRIKFFDDNNVVDAYRVIVHRNASRLFSTLLFECRCPISVTERFHHAVRELPFQSTQIPTKDGFLLQTALPSLDLPNLGSILQKHCDEVKVSWSDYDSSMRYWFWDEPYLNGKWLSTRKFMVKEVLAGLKPMI